MQRTNLATSRGRLIAAGAILAIMALTMLVTGISASAEDSNSQEAPVTGLSASTGSSPGEIDVSLEETIKHRPTNKTGAQESGIS